MRVVFVDDAHAGAEERISIESEQAARFGTLLLSVCCLP